MTAPASDRGAGGHMLQGSSLYFFFCSGNTDNLNTPLHLQLSDVLAGALILSLEHLISKFNRWVG